MSQQKPRVATTTGEHMTQKKPVPLPKPKKWDYETRQIARDHNGNVIPQKMIVEGKHTDGSPFSFEILARVCSFGEVLAIAPYLQPDEQVPWDICFSIVKLHVVEPDTTKLAKKGINPDLGAEILAIFAKIIEESGFKEEEIKKKVQRKS